jgi:hypothetical protein
MVFKIVWDNKKIMRTIMRVFRLTFYLAESLSKRLDKFLLAESLNKRLDKFSRHFLIPWSGGAFAPLGPFLCPYSAPPLRGKNGLLPQKPGP